MTALTTASLPGVGVDTVDPSWFSPTLPPGIGVNTNTPVSTSNIAMTSFSSMLSTTTIGDTTTLAAATTLSMPTNGFGGSWYNSEFNVPVYNRNQWPAVVETISWSLIDNFGQSMAQLAAISGVCLGLCLATLAYSIALTPTKKRSRPFHVFFLIALTAEIIRLLFDVICISKPGVSPFSGYLLLTLDFPSTYWSNEFINIFVAQQSAAAFAYVFTVSCLCIQASSLLNNVRLNHAWMYWFLIGILVSASAVALGFRITYTVRQVWAFQLKNTRLSYNISSAFLAATSASLAAWCLTCFTLIVWLLGTRLHLAISGGKLYQVALALLATTALESFLVPLILCILNLIPAASFIGIDRLVVPTILLVLPIGTLFSSVHDAQVGQRSGCEKQPKNASPGISEQPLMNSSDITTIITDHTALPALPHIYQGSYKLQDVTSNQEDPFGGQAGRGLYDNGTIEAYGSTRASDSLRGGYAPADDDFKQRARRIKHNLASRSTTPTNTQFHAV